MYKAFQDVKQDSTYEKEKVDDKKDVFHTCSPTTQVRHAELFCKYKETSF